MASLKKFGEKSILQNWKTLHVGNPMQATGACIRNWKIRGGRKGTDLGKD